MLNPYSSGINYIGNVAQQCATQQTQQRTAKDSYSGPLTGEGIAANVPPLPITMSANDAAHRARTIVAKLADLRGRIFGEAEGLSSPQVESGPSSINACLNEIGYELESAERQLDSILNRL